MNPSLEKIRQQAQDMMAIHPHLGVGSTETLLRLEMERCGIGP